VNPLKIRIHSKKISAHSVARRDLTLILLTWVIGWAPNNARKWQMGFILAFKGLILFAYAHLGPCRTFNLIQKSVNRGWAISYLPAEPLDVISCFRRGVSEILALLGRYAAFIASSRRFGTNCRSHIQWSSGPRKMSGKLLELLEPRR
jgi:hypothetical protein